MRNVSAVNGSGLAIPTFFLQSISETESGSAEFIHNKFSRNENF